MSMNVPIYSNADGSITSSLARLSTLADKQPDMWRRMLEANASKLYPVDLFAIGALKRSVALCSGFQSMVEQNNFTCAASLLRLQLDNALRFFATFLVENPHEFASAIARGTPIRQLKDKSGKQMNDAHLVKELSKQYLWVADVYKATCGYVHLSERHFHNAITSISTNDRLIGIQLTAMDSHLPDSIFLEAIKAFCAATEIFHSYIEGWIYSKSNPDILSKRQGCSKVRQNMRSSG